jgi:hypothetical protein
MSSHDNLPNDIHQTTNLVTTADNSASNRDEVAITVAPIQESNAETSIALPERNKKARQQIREVCILRIYGFSPFEHIKVRGPHHLSFILAGIEAFFASTSFAAPTITALVKFLNEFLVKHGKTPLAQSDLLSVLGLLCATPGFLLFQTGNRLTNEIILQRMRHCYRLQDLFTFGVTYRWFDETYNHDSQWMYGIEAIVLPIVHALLAASPASGLTQASTVINDPNYILRKFTSHRQVLLIVASMGTYLPILLINGTYLSKIICELLNKLAAKLGDTPEIAEKRAGLLDFLAQFTRIDFSQVDKEQLLWQLTEYKELAEKFSGEKLINLQLYKFAQLRQELNLPFYPDTRSMKIWRHFSSVAATVLAVIAAVPTYSLSYNLVNVSWFGALTSWAVGWKKCLLGTLIGGNAMLMPIPINYVSCKELLMSFANIKQLPTFLKNCSYVEARNIIFAIGLSAFSGIVAFYLAYANPMQLFKDCKETSPAWLVSILQAACNVINKIVPYANGVNSFALAFKSLLDFLTEYNLKVEKEALRNAQYMPGLYNKSGERHYQRHLMEAVQQMFFEEIARLENYIKRVSGKHKIVRLNTRADLENVEQQARCLKNRSVEEELISQSAYSQARLLSSYGTMRHRVANSTQMNGNDEQQKATNSIQMNSTNEQEADEELQALIQSRRAPRATQHWPCCTIL